MRTKYWLLAVLAVAIAASFLVERIIPYQVDWNRDHRDTVRDRIHVAVNEIFVLAGVAAVPLLALINPAAGIWPTGWPFVVQVLIAVLVADLGITVVHLASHKTGVLWRFHAVHHSITRFYGLNGLMKHPLHQTVEMAAGWHRWSARATESRAVRWLAAGTVSDSEPGSRCLQWTVVARYEHRRTAEEVHA